MKRRRNDTAENEPGNRRRVKGRGSERIHAKGAEDGGCRRSTRNTRKGGSGGRQPTGGRFYNGRRRRNSGGAGWA